MFVHDGNKLRHTVFAPEAGKPNELARCTLKYGPAAILPLLPSRNGAVDDLLYLVTGRQLPLLDANKFHHLRIRQQAEVLIDLIRPDSMKAKVRRLERMFDRY